MSKRRSLIGFVLGFACTLGAIAQPERAAATVPSRVDTARSSVTALVTAVDGVTITVSDLDRAVEFYTTVLACRKLDEIEQASAPLERLTGVFGARTREATLALGQERLRLVQFLAPEGRPVPPDSRSNDRWFQHIAIVVSDIDRAYAHLRAHRVRHASTGPQTLPPSIPAAAGISAFYFKDPDGHALEIIQFPSGKGDPRWHVSPRDGELFLGIDHTAIVVADTDVSMRFYRDVLGMRVAGESENAGTEQEHLNNVFGARLRITALRAASGPGVELLEYLTPRDGRAAPLDSRLNDLWTWRTELRTEDMSLLARTLRGAKITHVSPEPVESLGDTSLTVRDPDGHAITITQPR